MWRELTQNPRALIYAVLVHALLLMALAVSLDWVPKPQGNAETEIIQATVVDSAKIDAEFDKLKAIEQRKRNEESERQREREYQVQELEALRRTEQARLEELKRQHEAEQQRIAADKQYRQEEQKLAEQVEAERLAKLKADKVIEQQRIIEANKKKAAEEEAQRKKKREQLLKAKQDAEQKAKEEARRKAVAEAERKAQEDARRRESEEELADRLAAEQQEQQALAGKQLSDLVARYMSVIRQQIQNNWLRPQSTAPGLSCVVSVRVIAGGEVVAVRVVESSGDPAFDRSVENAIYKTSPLPLPPDPTLAERFHELRFVFNPED